MRYFLPTWLWVNNDFDVASDDQNRLAVSSKRHFSFGNESDVKKIAELRVWRKLSNQAASDPPLRGRERLPLAHHVAGARLAGAKL